MEYLLFLFILLALVAIPAVLTFKAVYYFAAKIKTNRRRNIFFLLSCVVPLAVTILRIFTIVYNPRQGADPLGLLYHAVLVSWIGLGTILATVIAIIVWKRKKLPHPEEHSNSS